MNVELIDISKATKKTIPITLLVGLKILISTFIKICENVKLLLVAFYFEVHLFFLNLDRAEKSI